jgi:hypothetical protein
MTVSTNIEIVGLKDALKNLNKLEPSLRRGITKEYKSIVSDERNLETKTECLKKRHPLQPNMLQLKVLKKQKLSVQIVKLKSLQKNTCPT